MTDRDFDSANDAALDAAHVPMLVFVQVEWDSGTAYMHSGVGSYVWGGQTWTGVGDFGGIESFEEGDRLVPYQVGLSLSGLDSSLLTEVLTGDVIGRGLTIYLGFLDADLALLADPEEVWSGTISEVSGQAGAESVINVTGEDELANFKRTAGGLFSDADQQQTYSGDLAFQYADQIADGVQIKWGGKSRNFRAGLAPVDSQIGAGITASGGLGGGLGG